MWKYIFSLLLVIGSAMNAAGQEKTRKDTTRFKFVPTGIRIGTDVLALVLTQTSPKFEGWEVHGDIDFTRYYLTADYGFNKLTRTLENGTYASEGNYLRMGADVNFLLKDVDRNMVFLGARYGTTTFSQNAVFTYNDDVFGSIEKTVIATDVEASWAEITGGLRVKIWKLLWMGYTARFKFGLNTRNEGNLKAYDIPGYGLTVKSNAWGFNYQIFVRIPVRKQK